MLVFLTTAQNFDTTYYNIRFVSEQESMWNTHSAYTLPPFSKTYTFSWDMKQRIGGIESVVGMKFGAEMFARTKGTIGMEFYMSDIGVGTIDSVVYPMDIEFIVPDAADIRAGQTILIQSKVKVTDTHKPTIETTFPVEGKVGVKMIMDLVTDLNFSMCAFSECVRIDPKSLTACSLPGGGTFGVKDIMDFKFNKPILEINTLNSNPRIIIPAYTTIPCAPDLSINIPCKGKHNLIGDYTQRWPSTRTIEIFPIEFGAHRTLRSKHPKSFYIEKCLLDPATTVAQCNDYKDIFQAIKGDTKLSDFLVGAFTMPFIDTLYTTISGHNLRATGSDSTLAMTFKPLNLVAAGKFANGRFDLPIPCTGASFYANYMLIRPEVTLDAIAKQRFDFNGIVVVELVLPVKLKYMVKKDDKITKQGNDSIIVYEVGQDLYIDYPCNYEFIDFNPTFRVLNSITNKTSVSLNFDGTVKMLEVGIGMSEITVVPEIKIHIPVPFTDGYTITIPSVKFGFDVSVGPLVNAKVSKFMSNPNDLQVEIDIFNKTWEIASFQQIKTPAFRIAPTRFNTTVNPDTIACFGQTSAQLTAIVSGGTPPYTYLWSNSAQTQSISNIPAASYYVKVTDKNGCSTNNGASVFEYPQLQIYTHEVRNPSCFGYSNGAIHIEISGGRPPYTYTWSHGANSSSAENLLAGTYKIIVTDYYNCSVEQEYILTQPSLLTSSVSKITNVDCKNEATGSIQINVSGGVPSYDFEWLHGAISQNVENLLAGDYSVIITDKNNCTTTSVASIIEPQQLQAAIEVSKPISCYKGSDGELFANITGGAPPYSITWYNPRNKLYSDVAVLSQVFEGVYQLEVYDSHNCYKRDTLVIFAPQERFASELVETHVSCNNASDGEFKISVFGGTPPYTFVWSDGALEQNRTGLSAGKYNVVITDSKQCVTYNNMVILEPFPLQAQFTMKQVSCDGEHDGQLQVFVTGGTAPFNYVWSNGHNESVASNIPQGPHTVWVTDTRGCEKEFEYVVTVDGSKCFDIPNTFSPNGDNYNDTWIIKNISAMFPNNKVEIFSQNGDIVYSSETHGYEPWDGTRNGTNVPSGTYYYVIDLGNNSQVLKGTITIVR